jgi:hypothetical protein
MRRMNPSAGETVGAWHRIGPQLLAPIARCLRPSSQFRCLLLFRYGAINALPRLLMHRKFKISFRN